MTRLQTLSIAGISLFVVIGISLIIWIKPADSPQLTNPSTVIDHADDDNAAESLATVVASYQSTQRALGELKTQYQALKDAHQNTFSTLSARLNALSVQQAQVRAEPIHTRHQPAPKKITWVDDMAPLKAPDHDDHLIPRYTIAPNTTALKVPLLTALVGRLSVNHALEDPYPFQLVLSPHLLIACGYHLPQLSGMMLSGYATGDSNLKSVRGWITSATFIFQDGRIAHIAAPKQNGHLNSDNTLGYLADPYGNPFIPGKLISNATGQIGMHLLLNTSGDMPIKKDQGMLGWLWHHSLKDRMKETQSWWEKHHPDSFDAIYVPAGQEVAVHFTQAIPIDYHTQGRKLTYENTTHQLDTWH